MTALFVSFSLTFARLFNKQLHRLSYGLLVLLAMAGIPAAAVQASDSLITDFARAELLSSVEATGDVDVIQLGLQVSLQPGWKIYWRSPGDAGLPTRLLLSEDSPSEQILTMDYPIPERFSLFGLDTYGYGDQVVF